MHLAVDSFGMPVRVIDAEMEAVIPPKKNQKDQRQYDKDIYENRHHVENMFLKLKQWRCIATRYAKKASSFIASVQICAMFMWLSIL